MWVGKDYNGLKLKTKFESHLNHAFAGPEEHYSWHWEQFQTPSEVELFLLKEPVPHLTIINPCEELPPGHESWAHLCSGLKSLASNVCILALSPNESAPSGDEALSWLDQGADGLINLNAEFDNTYGLLRELLTIPLKTFHSRHARVAARHQVTVRLSSFTQAMVSETINIGTGGIFIRSVPPNVTVGDTVEFVLRFSDTIADFAGSETRSKLVDKVDEEVGASIRVASSDLSGVGKVAWVRQSPKGDLPEGIGVEFVQLSEESSDKLKDFVASRRVKAFIPKS